MDNQVDEVKQKTDIVSIISERIELKKAGRNYKANCPFHSEKTPSFMVSPELQIFKCFGCSESGDVFTFLQKYEGMEFGEALKYLADKARIKLKPFKGGLGTSEKERIVEVNSQALRFYNYILLNHQLGKSALEYLMKDRGLKRKTIEEFQLGFAPIDSIYLKKFLVDKKKFNLKETESAGIGVLRGSNLIDRFRGRVIFPLFDHRGNSIGFAGRIMPGAREDLAKYINSPETLAYHKSNVLYGLNLTRQFVKIKKVAIVVEGELDAISSYQAGVKNVVAIKGSALTPEQVRLLSRFSEKIILALDTDIAGDTAARSGITIAGNAGLDVRVARLSGFKDPDEAARADPDSYKKSLINAIGVWDYLIDSVFERFSSKGPSGNLKISKEICLVLASIEDKIIQAGYIDKVAKKLSIPFDAVAAQVEKTQSQDEKETKKEKTDVVEKRDRRTLLEENVLTLCFQFNPKRLLKKDLKNIFKTSLAKRILEAYEVYSKKHKSFNLSNFAKTLPSELFGGFAEILLKEDNNIKELDVAVKELKILIVKQKLAEIAESIQKLEDGGEKEELLKAQNKLNTLAASLSKLEDEDVGGIILEDVG
ncbi:DNA primase [Patescibacteria group bacterium]